MFKKVLEESIKTAEAEEKEVEKIMSKYRRLFETSNSNHILIVCEEAVVKV